MKKIIACVIAGAATFGSTGALALDCLNQSRPPAAGVQEGGFTVVGNWAYVNDPESGFVGWTFIPPGTIPFAPGSNGNFRGGGEESFALLVGTGACGNEARQTTKGIQAGECLGETHP